MPRERVRSTLTVPLRGSDELMPTDATLRAAVCLKLDYHRRLRVEDGAIHVWYVSDTWLRQDRVPEDWRTWPVEEDWRL